MAFCSCRARAVSGRPCPGSLARARPCIGAFSGGRMRGGGKRCGACSCNMPRRRSSSSGCGSRPMRPYTKRHWVGKKRGRTRPTARSPDQAPCPHRRRRRTARRGDHGGERARHARGWASCLMPACSVLPPAPSSTRASTKARTTPTRNGQCAADGTCRTSVAAAKNGGAVRAANVRVAGSSSAPTRGSTAFASCSYGGRRDRRTTSRSSSSPPC